MANARVITPEATLSYPHLFESDEKGKFGAVLVFAKGTDLGAMKKAFLAVAQDKFGDKAADMVRKGQIRFMGGPHHAFRTDGEDKYGAGAVYINARTNARPGVVSVFPDANGKPLVITDEEQVYPGCVVRASVTPYWYDVDGNKGIAWALNNVQKLRDGDRLDSRVKAEDEFEADANAMADLDALTADVPVGAAAGGDDSIDELLA
jgi:hypothetical protein